MGTNGNATKGFEFNKFATPRIIGGIAIAIIVLWALSILFGGGSQPSPSHDTAPVHETASESAAASAQSTAHAPAPATTDHGATPKDKRATSAAGHADTATPTHKAAAAPQQPAAKAEKRTPATKASGHTASSAGAADTAADDHGTQSQSTAGHPLPHSVTAAHKPAPKGVAFVEAAMQPMYYELEERWWGWRPNDIINVTDNVNNFQLGVLEVTRRTTVALGERISRHGTTDAFNEDLENAMNWFMVKAKSYWFPSAESKYRDGLEEMEAYLEKLKAGKATFYTRTDNLIPLLASFEDLLGSCDENLVKEVNEDGSPVSFFAVDNYFYYTQGVASSMATILEAVHHDFLLTLESRNGTELLHHAIVSCQRAAELDPWIILDSSLSSVFANHRANMAAPISHARFYLGQLIKTLST